ncbi:MAG TPA: hypothetical protein PLK79_08395, partial [Thermoleophilia bacterium]|nr:hypothetical protein [Thermoleophilia bacterium]
SIGRQAIEVLPCVPQVRLVGLAADTNVAGVLEQAAASGAAAVALRDPAAARQAAASAQHAAAAAHQAVARAGSGAAPAAPSDLRPHTGAAPAAPSDLRPHTGAAPGLRVYEGEDGIRALIHNAADAARAEGASLTVLNAIVGAAGLRATLAALECGATLALANKESMVAGGPFVVAAARASGARVVPVDSEHSALFQCLMAGAPRSGDEQGVAGAPQGGGEEAAQSAAAAAPCAAAAAPAAAQSAAPAAPAAPSATQAVPVASAPDPYFAVEELVLTGSGGPFRTATDDELARATPERALAHPTWSMGPKVTIDSATLMNKGLEVIEAHYLFGVPYERIAVLLNPQSVVHSMVRFADGAILAHLGVPDMRVPIAYALGYPDVRPTLPMVRRLDLLAGDLTFAKPDVQRFRCLALAIEAGKKAAAAERAAGCTPGVCAPGVCPPPAPAAAP